MNKELDRHSLKSEQQHLQNAQNQLINDATRSGNGWQDEKRANIIHSLMPIIKKVDSDVRLLQQCDHLVDRFNECARRYEQWQT